MIQPMSTAARHSTDSPDWITPSSYVAAARQVMGGIDLDPASDAEANAIHQIPTIYTAGDDDGLHRPWSGRIFLNPPGGLVAAFWHKLLQEVVQRRVTQAIWIGYSLEQLQTLQRVASFTPLHYPLCYPERRIAFQENTAKYQARRAKAKAAGKPFNHKGSPSHANYIAYLGPRVDRFVEVFSAFGTCVVPARVVGGTGREAEAPSHDAIRD